MLMPLGGRVLRLGQDEPAPGVDSPTSGQADASMLLDPGNDPGMANAQNQPAFTLASLPGQAPPPEGSPMGMDQPDMGGMAPPPQGPPPGMGASPSAPGPGLDPDSPNPGMLGGIGPGGKMGALSSQDGANLRAMVKKLIALRGHK
jgi:hypothetical protein